MSLGVVNPCSVLQLSVLVMAAPPGGRTWFLAALSAVLIAGHLYILQSCPGSSLHFHELGTHLPAKHLIAGKSCKFAALGSFSERNRFEVLFVMLLSPRPKRAGQDNSHTQRGCVLALPSVDVWQHKWAWCLLPLIAPSWGAQGQQPSIWTLGQSLLQPIPQGREQTPLSTSSALPQEGVLDWVESCHILSLLPTFANHGAPHTSSV